VDSAERIVAVLGGTPKDSSWMPLMNRLLQKIRTARSKMTFSRKQTKQPRGDFPSVSVGNSFGGGSKVCLFLNGFVPVSQLDLPIQRPGTMAFYGNANKRTLLSLMACQGFLRLVGFANCAYLSVSHFFGG
jgi:hypothetical protein